MNWTAVLPQALRLMIGLAASVLTYWSFRQTGVSESLRSDAEGLGTIITLIGSIYAVVFAFVIFVIWGQFTEVENAGMRECGSLNDLLRFNHYLNADANRTVRRAVTEYAQRVINSEWHSLGEGHRDQPTEKAFATLLSAVLRAEPATPAEEGIVQRMIDIARKTGEQRDERIAKSLTRIPPTLLGLVRVMAGALLVLTFFYPFHSWVAGACCFSTLGVILFLSNLVMTDTDDPFDGIFNVSAQPFSELTS